MTTAEAERFEVLRRVDQRERTSVFCARDRTSGRLVAFKRMRVSGDQALRFDYGARALCGLQHPGIATHIAYGLDGHGQAWLASEWVEGESLAQRLARGPLDLQECVALAQRLSSALVATEAAQLVHRNLTPANVLMPDGKEAHAVLVGFGLARDEQQAQGAMTMGSAPAHGTPAYMSPEQAHGDAEVTPRSDVFSLGAILYECLAGKPPFEGASGWATLMKVCVAAPEPVRHARPDVPPSLDALLAAMLSKTASDRPDPWRIQRALTAITPEQLMARPSVPQGRRPSRPSLQSGTELRVICALFVRPVSELHELQRAWVRRLAEEHGGRAQQLMDGTWAVLMDGALSASDQALAAARCARRLQELERGTAVAMCLGRMSMQHGAPAGAVVDDGMKLLGDTPEGTIRVDEDSAELLAARFEMMDEDGPPRLGAEILDDGAPTTGGRVLSPFVGRERELATLATMFHQCLQERQARAVLITGGVGTGKSRLLQELRGRMQPQLEDCEVLVGRGEVVQRGVRFGAIAPALHAFAGLRPGDDHARRCTKLRERVGELLPRQDAADVSVFLGEIMGVPFDDGEHPLLRAARKDPQLMADWVLSSWLSWLEALCRARPLLLIIEDLHWADPASVRFLQSAMRTAADLPLMVALSAHPEGKETFPELWSQRDVQLLQLSKLSERDSAVVLDARLEPKVPQRDRQLIIERADGNPFFLEELARSYTNNGLKELPHTVAGTLQRSLDALGDDAKWVLQAASVFGQRFSVEDIKAVLAPHAPSLEVGPHLRMLEEMDVIERERLPSQEGYRFRHGLLRQVAYDLLPEDDRILAHRLAADWLAHRPHVAPALLAAHYERGAARSQAAMHYCAASLQAMQGGTMQEVVRLATRSIECGAKGRVLGESASLRAEGVCWTGDNTEALHWAQVATQHLVEGSEAWWRAVQVRTLSALRGADSAVEQYARAMVEQVKVSGWSPAATVAVGYVAAEACLRGRAELGVKLALLLPDSRTPELRGIPEGAIHWAQMEQARFQGHHELALRCANWAAEAFRSVGANLALANALLLQGFVSTQLGLNDIAENCARECRRLSIRTGTKVVELCATLNLATIERQKRASETARSLSIEAMFGFRNASLPSFEAAALSELARIEVDSGNVESGLNYAHRAVNLDASDPTLHSLALAALCHAQVAAGEIDAARMTGERALQLVREHKLTREVMAVWVEQAEALLAGGDVLAARRLTQEAWSIVKDQASKIDSSALRKAFFRDVPEHRQLAELMAR